MRVVVFYHRGMGERCRSARYRLQTRREGFRKLTRPTMLWRVAGGFEPDGAMPSMLASPARSRAPGISRAPCGRLVASVLGDSPQLGLRLARAAYTSTPGLERAAAVNSAGTPSGSIRRGWFFKPGR